MWKRKTQRYNAFGKLVESAGRHFLAMRCIAATSGSNLKFPLKPFFVLSLRPLAAILVERHPRRGCYVVAVSQSPHGNLNHIVEQFQEVLGEPRAFVADHQGSASLEFVSMKIH